MAPRGKNGFHDKTRTDQSTRKFNNFTLRLQIRCYNAGNWYCTAGTSGVLRFHLVLIIWINSVYISSYHLNTSCLSESRWFMGNFRQLYRYNTYICTVRDDIVVKEYANWKVNENHRRFRGINQ